ncbi:MAG: VanZ family protein [Microbacterium sp.]
MDLLVVGRVPSRSHARFWLAMTGLLVYLAVVLLATLSPTPLDQGYESSIEQLLDVLHSHGVPEWYGYNKLEFSANVAMFVPVGFLLALALPRRGIWLVVIVIPAFSATIELLQAAFLAERFASVLDVVANTAGGYLGAVAAIGMRAAIATRDQRVIARAAREAQHCP